MQSINVQLSTARSSIEALPVSIATLTLVQKVFRVNHSSRRRRKTVRHPFPRPPNFIYKLPVRLKVRAFTRSRTRAGEAFAVCCPEACALLSSSRRRLDPDDLLRKR